MASKQTKRPSRDPAMEMGGQKSWEKIKDRWSDQSITLCLFWSLNIGRLITLPPHGLRPRICIRGIDQQMWSISIYILLLFLFPSYFYCWPFLELNSTNSRGANSVSPIEFYLIIIAINHQLQIGPSRDQYSCVRHGSREIRSRIFALNYCTDLVKTNWTPGTEVSGAQSDYGLN